MPREEECPQGQKPDFRKIVEDLKKMDPRIKSIKTIGDAKSPIFQLEFENRGKYTLSISQQNLTLKYGLILTEITYDISGLNISEGGEIKIEKGKEIGRKKQEVDLDASEIHLELPLMTTSRPMSDNQVNALDTWFARWQEERYEESEQFWLDTEDKKLSMRADISITPNLPKDITDYVEELIEIVPIVTQEAENILRKNR